MGEEIKEREVEIKLGDLWHVFKHCWIAVVAALLVVFVGLYIFLNVTHVPEYTATAKIYVLNLKNPEDGGNNNISSTDITIANHLIKDCQELLLSEDNVLNPVLSAQDLDAFMDAHDLARMISYKTSSVSDRTLLLTVTTTDQTRSADLANAVAEKVCEYFNQSLYNQKILQVTDSAKAPTNESNSVSPLKVGLVALVAAILVYAVFFVKFMLDDKINTGEDVERYLGVSVLGIIPNKYDVSRRRKSKNGYYYSGSYGAYGAQYGGSSEKGTGKTSGKSTSATKKQ